MPFPDQRDLDGRIQAFYGEAFDEATRLTTRSTQGPLEFQRTQELIRRHTHPGGRVVDIGGGGGTHARALVDAGYEVTLFDPVQRHVEAARSARVDAHVGDARNLPFRDQSFDVALLLGPLYHLASPTDRRRALDDAARVLVPGGVLFAAALSRYVAFGSLSLAQPIPSRLPNDWAALIVHGSPSPQLRFPAGHFHTAEDLHDEVDAAGFEVQAVVDVEGPAGVLLEEVPDLGDAVRDAAMVIARAAASVPGIRDQSTHLIAMANKRA